MNKIKRRATFCILVAGGFICIGVAIGLPYLIPILVPIGAVMLSGAFAMFQSVIKPSGDPESNSEKREEQAPNVCMHDAPPTINTVNMLFMYNHIEMQQTEVDTHVNSLTPKLTLV